MLVSASVGCILRLTRRLHSTRAWVRRPKLEYAMCFSQYIASVLGLLLMYAAHAQTEMDLVFERLTELEAEELAEDFDFSELAERLVFYQRNPIDLNRTDGRELRELQFVPQLFIDNLLEHRNR